MGDIDNDGILDLFVVCAEGTRLLIGKSDGGFVDTTAQAGLGVQAPGGRSALLLDADHDGDLDILVCNPGPLGNQLWNNNADGTFTNIALAAGIACPNGGCTMALAGDLDGDRDTDLVICAKASPAKSSLMICSAATMKRTWAESISGVTSAVCCRTSTVMGNLISWF